MRLLELDGIVDDRCERSCSTDETKRGHAWERGVKGLPKTRKVTSRLIFHRRVASSHFMLPPSSWSCLIALHNIPYI